MPVNNAMTADFLRSAYGGESMAHMRYLIWGDIKVHADNHFKVLGKQIGDNTVPAGAVFGVQKTVDNLQGAINGELHEVEQMYPVNEEKDAQRSFRFALEAEKIHSKLFKDAQDKAKQGKDIEFGAIHICPVCGCTETGDVPDVCPICGAKKEVFKKF